MNTSNCTAQPKNGPAWFFTASIVGLALYVFAAPTVLSGASIFSNVDMVGAIELVGLVFIASIAAVSFRARFAEVTTQPMPAATQLPSVKEAGFQPDYDTSESSDLDSEQRFSLVLRTFDIATFYCDLEHRYTWSHNFLGSPDDLLGKTDPEIMPADAANTLLGLKKKALEDGGMHSGELSFDIGIETRTFSVQVAPRRDRIGNIIGTMAVSADVTEKALWQKHLVMMMREVNHRARNLLAIVVSICGQTARSATSVAEYKEKITGRVMSLAASMDLVTKDNWVASSLKKLFMVQIDVLPKDKAKRIHIEGADLLVKSSAVQSIGLAIHELATNAAQHGALSHPSGRVEVTISSGTKEHDPTVAINWREKSLLKTPQTHKNGFGFLTLNNIVASELNGESNFTWHPDGVEYHLTMPGEVTGVDPQFAETAAKNGAKTAHVMRESLTGEIVRV